MLPELGLFFLILALLVASLQAAYLVPAARVFIAPCLPPAAWLQSLLITLAFATLMILRLGSDFSVVNVAENSNLALPMLYKIAGTWGNHEGSMLLWVWVLALFGTLLAFQTDAGRQVSDVKKYSDIRRTAIAVQALLCAGFLLFILCTSSPFIRIFPPPPDGEALNPLLQDIGLAMHPPMLYLGYVGFSIVFSLAVAALLSPLPPGEGDAKRRMRASPVAPPSSLPLSQRERDYMKSWAELAHPWILAAWSALTIGIGLGSWWAYRVLGWGGFWFWDPVENASLLPWLSGTALLHSNIALKKRGVLGQWVVLLAIVTFGLSLLGTFLTRSGVLISVHSFASDPQRGMFILAMITAIMGAALLLFCLRAGNLSPEMKEKITPLAREGMIVINNLFLLTACATVLLGTLYPMLAELAGDRISVGAPYFNAAALPMLAIPLIFAGLAAFMPWKQAPLRQAVRQAAPALMAALAALLLTLALAKEKAALAALGFSLAAWLAASSLRWLKHRSTPIPAVFLAHLGAAIVVIGITGAGLWQQEKMTEMKPGDSDMIAGYPIAFQNAAPIVTPNYHGRRGEFIVRDKSGNEIARLQPEYRTYDIAKTSAGVPAISHSLSHDLYIAIGATADGGTAVRLYYNPLISCLWIGCLLMAAGGIATIIQQGRHS